MSTARRRAASVAVAALSVAMLLVGLAPARAEDPASATASGTAHATAIVTRLTPGVGSLPTGIFGGVAITDVTNEIALAQSETLDLGLIGLLVSALGIVPSEDLPTPLDVDNRTGDASATEDEYPIAGTTLGAGHKVVRATVTPSSRAVSTLVSSFGDVVSVEAGRAEASSSITDGSTREATASVSADLVIAGVVHLSGLRWRAVHRTGPNPHAEATFGIDSAEIGGVAIPVGSLTAVEAAVNAALAPLGIAIHLPKVERRLEPTDVVGITPLQVELRDTPAGKAALGPVLGLTREQREQLFDDLTEASSTLAAPLLAADVAASILSGTGFLSIDVGGAEATSGAVPSRPATAVPAPTPASGPLPTIDATPSVGSRPNPARGAGGDAAPLELRRSCESTHARRPLHCSGGVLVPAGLAGLAITGAAAVADLRHSRRRRPGASTGPRRTLRGYLPLMAASGALIVLATAVGVPRAHPRYEGVLSAPEVRPPAVDASGAPVLGPIDAAPGVGVPPASGAALRRCADRALQVVGDPYSPPCFAFSGDNGGATSRGVTRDSIIVSVRDVEAGSATDIFAGLANQDIESTEASVQDTLDALAQYFSDHFQLYGRRLEIRRYRGTGNGINELLGGGKEAALADAVASSKEIGAFADVSAITLPYSDALARNGVINVGAPYPSRKWFEERAPYSWSLFPDGTNIAAATTSAIVGRFPPGSRAEHAGSLLRERPRRFAVVAPENAEYQESVNVFLDLLRDAHIDVAANVKYKLDLASFPNQASNIIAQVKDDGVTSVICMCDPAMLAFGLTPKANEQDYEPEWITAGLVFVDQDVVAQTIDTRQWSHAFGTAYNAESERIGGSYPYFAYKSVRPHDEPALGVEELYYQLYLLVIGLQMAGPDLTPATFQQGMFAYPGAFGPRGTWDFGPGDHTPTNDYREIWWDPDRISTQNDDPGTWVELGGGRRWSPQHPPSGRAPFFEEG